MADRIPVLIVGGGPVGLALAGDLGYRGVKSLLVEARGGTIFQPKMDMIGIRSMEFCRRWGITDDVHSAGYNRDYIQDCAWVTNLNGYEFGREEFPAPKDEKNPLQSPEHRERCPQNFFDPVLKRFAGSTGDSEIRYRTELVSFVDHGDHVTATLRDRVADTTYDVEADFLVGSDGGDSTVRNRLGIEMSGEGALTYTSNAIIECDGLEDLHTTAPAYRYIFIGPEGTWATLVAINGRDHWRFSLIGDETQRDVSEDEMRAAVVRAVGREFDFTILSMLPWVRRQLVADSYRSGRVFLAGDSAHLTSPTGGFGMNTGLLDAVNLSWKLAAVIQGWGGEVLLDSYEYEQRPIAIRNVTESGDNLRRMLGPRVAKPKPEVFDDDSPETEAARREYGDAYTEAMKREWHSIGIHLGYVYEGSPIVVPDGSPMPPLTVQTYEQNARPGSRAPHAWLAEDRSTLDEFGKEFVLMRFDGGIDTGDLTQAATDAGIPLRLVDIDNAEVRELYGTPLTLVRPDGSVAWRGHDAPADPASLVRRVAGRQVLATLG
ncbi:FAD-dependent oxidoreductase [Gordonia humi]|uniref:2-polyprenyl-6-methoxyphenol hydroxylase-like FAD-dependent oxidoreductase n=1 Tax=Gordonia humi TaxID=686429 RepID=A0A840F1W0_9ACTN|nr:FAD-dependent oxidoreductase [Gordonia humi]MBB4133567.1 2-polyprenyl-6-methoxyphenol hydroxylase-like FAD-dependent oxidoreductase [Gordonia humi]